MTSIPHKFFLKEFEREQGYKLPALGQYATGNLFFKPDATVLERPRLCLRMLQTSSI
jgi:glutamate synthase (NADPH/NADH)